MLEFVTKPSFFSMLPSYLFSAVSSLGFPILNSTLNCETGNTPQLIKIMLLIYLKFVHTACPRRLSWKSRKQ